MSKTISVFLNNDRAYAAYVENTREGVKLIDFDSTKTPPDLEDADSEQSKQAKAELEQIFLDFDSEYDRLNVTLPDESVLVAQFPGKADISHSELVQLVHLEIRQVFPHINMRDFATKIIHFADKLDGSAMMLACIFSKEIIKVVESFVSKLEMPIANFEIAQINAQNSFFYNYPEFADQNVALLGLQKQFADVSLLKGGKSAYYNLISMNEGDSLADISSVEFTILLSEYVEKIDMVYFFGAGLTKDILDQAKQTLNAMGLPAERLNAFRMIRTDLGERERQYCQRVAHLFPPCIGGCLPPKHDIVYI